MNPDPTTPASPFPAPGDAAPDFTLFDQSGNPFTLSGQRGHALVLFFYPKDCTSACTDEAKDFSRLRPRFRKAGAEVVGVSMLNQRSKRKFIEQAALKLRLLADERVNADKKPDPEVSRRYNVWGEKSMYGRAYMGIIRTTLLIDPVGVVLRRWDGVTVPGHAEEVLGAVTALGLGPIPSRRSAPAAR